MNNINMNMNIFDAVVFSVVGLSALVAFFRGFIRELLSLGAWVGAALITMYFFPRSTAMMENHVKDPHIAAGIGIVSTYIAALVGISIINSIIIRYVKTGMEVGLFDNFLGLLFGALRGMFIVSIGYLIMTSVVSPDNPPDWMKGSITQQYVQQSANFLVSVAPDYLHDMQGMVKSAQGSAQQQEQGVGQSISNDASTYKQDIRNDLNQMMNSAKQGTR